MAISDLWVERYRPSTVNDVIFTNEGHRKKFQRYMEKKEIPNLLLYGGPGTGKSSVSGAICSDLIRMGVVDRSDIMRVKCSDDKIEFIRNKAKVFATTMPLGNFKIIQLEEFDNIGVDAQLLLRSMIEDVSSNARFIATCNYPNKLIPEMRSRFTEYGFKSPGMEEVAAKCVDILEAEGIKYEVDALLDVIQLAYPDFRKILVLMEESCLNGELDIDTADKDSIANWKLELLPLIDAGDWVAARKTVCASATKEEMPEIFRFLYSNIGRSAAMKKVADQATVLIAQYQYQHAFVADPEIQLAALFIELTNL